jgi:hypothetical protein
MMHYSIKPLATGYRLTIWEPAALTPDRVQPFLFKLNFTILYPQEAEKILDLIPGQKTQAVKVKGPISGQLALLV